MKFKFPFSFQLKRFCAMICAVVLCLSMTACGGSEQPSNGESNPKPRLCSLCRRSRGNVYRISTSGSWGSASK